MTKDRKSKSSHSGPEKKKGSSSGEDRGSNSPRSSPSGGQGPNGGQVPYGGKGPSGGPGSDAWMRWRQEVDEDVKEKLELYRKNGYPPKQLPSGQLRHPLMGEPGWDGITGLDKDLLNYPFTRRKTQPKKQVTYRPGDQILPDLGLRDLEGLPMSMFHPPTSPPPRPRQVAASRSQVSGQPQQLNSAGLRPSSPRQASPTQHQMSGQSSQPLSPRTLMPPPLPRDPSRLPGSRGQEQGSGPVRTSAGHAQDQSHRAAPYSVPRQHSSSGSSSRREGSSSKEDKGKGRADGKRREDMR